MNPALAVPFQDQEQRCRCGHLLAVLCETGVEIKCKRCKQTQTLSLERLIQILKKDKEPLSSDPSRRSAIPTADCPCH